MGTLCKGVPRAQQCSATEGSWALGRKDRDDLQCQLGHFSDSCTLRATSYMESITRTFPDLAIKTQLVPLDQSLVTKVRRVHGGVCGETARSAHQGILSFSEISSLSFSTELGGRPHPT